MKNTRSRQPALPPISSRTLHHPSFLPLYLAADCAHHHGTGCNNQPVHPSIIPAELFYSDPSMSRGRRIPNTVSDLRASNPTWIQTCVSQQPWDKSLADTINTLS